jgi:ribosomal protein S17
MAAARVPRTCAAISPIDIFAMNPTFSILRSLLPRVPSTTCRARRPLPIAKLPARSFSATVASSAADPNQPLQQESEASRRREETLQESTPDAEEEEAIPNRNPSPAAGPSLSKDNTPKTETTPRASSRPFPTRSESDWDFVNTSRRITGTVIRSDTMAKTVAVATNRQHFDRFLQKHYTRPSKTLVHDPADILVEGDVIEYGLFGPMERAERMKMGKGKRVKYVLRRVVTPFGASVHQRAKKRMMATEG